MVFLGAYLGVCLGVSSRARSATSGDIYKGSHGGGGYIRGHV